MRGTLMSAVGALMMVALIGCESIWGPSLPAEVDAKWCSIGTSITWYNSHPNRFKEGYQTRVLKQLKFREFVNVGVNGGCVSSAPGSVVPADVYTIEHGINDWGHSVKVGTIDDYVNNTSNGTFAATYRKLIDRIREVSPSAKIVLCTPRKAYGFGTYLPASSSEPKKGIYLAEYAEVVRAIAAREGFPVADFYARCGENDELESLSIDKALHPNDAGFERMAQELVPALVEALW